MIMDDKDKKGLAIIIANKIKPSEAPEDKEPEEGEEDESEMMAEELCQALEAKDYKAVAAAFEALFDYFESKPHEEYPHDEME